LHTADDAAVYRLSDTMAAVFTVDYFTPIVDDPYWYGAIAAANSLSDIYAMGARPVLALNLVGFPTRERGLPLSILHDILRGGADKAREAGALIAGGHSIDDNEPKYGMAVFGLADPDRLTTKAGARPLDQIVLTKPLGMGIISTAIKRDLTTPDVVDEAIRIMATLNRAAAEVAHAAELEGATDITGYGLLGHLLEMCRASGVAARLNAGAVPALPAAEKLAAKGVYPGGSKTNREFVEPHLRWDAAIPETTRMVFADAQTSGGLLLAVPPDRLDDVLNDLRARHTPAAAHIGEFVAGEPEITVAP